MVYDPSMIWRNYLTGWFTIDVLSIFPFEYIKMDANVPTSMLRLVRLARLIKLVKLTRLTRIIKSSRSQYTCETP